MNRLHATTVLVLALSGCVFGYTGNFSYPNTQCRRVITWCVIDVPSAGYLGFNATSVSSLDQTLMLVRFAPRDGVTAAWSSPDITVIDRDNGKEVVLKGLDTRQVVGHLTPSQNEDTRVAYGPYAEGSVNLTPRITKMEVRFPPLLVHGRAVQVPSVLIDDGPRTLQATFIGFHH